MANDGGKVLRASTVKKARDRAQKEQFVVVGKWPPPKPVMSKKEAEFYGEDMGWLAKLANSAEVARSGALISRRWACATWHRSDSTVRRGYALEASNRVADDC